MKENNLSAKECIPCKGGVPALPEEEKLILLKQLHNDWLLKDDNTKLSRVVAFKDYKSAWDVLNLLSEIAQEQWHHPDLLLSFGKLEITIFTHKINNLVESDFILASKFDLVIP